MMAAYYTQPGSTQTVLFAVTFKIYHQALSLMLEVFQLCISVLSPKCVNTFDCLSKQTE